MNFSRSVGLAWKFSYVLCSCCSMVQMAGGRRPQRSSSFRSPAVKAVLLFVQGLISSGRPLCRTAMYSCRVDGSILSEKVINTPTSSGGWPIDLHRYRVSHNVDGDSQGVLFVPQLGAAKSLPIARNRSPGFVTRAELGQLVGIDFASFPSGERGSTSKCQRKTATSNRWTGGAMTARAP